jgi:TrmH family RNA methyltransferase
MISVVCIEIENPGNLGAIARIMKNFGLKNMILINSKCNKNDLEAVHRAKHAKDVLKKAKNKDIDYLKKFDYIIGTTSKLGTDYNIPRTPVTPEELGKRIIKIKNKKIAILLGKESSGLTNKQILMCDFIVTIPANKEYPALNISHALSIILYEIFKNTNKEKITDFEMASKKEKDVILKLINKIIDNMDFATEQKKETQKKLWKRIVGKSMLTKREAFALLGFLKKLV